MYNITQAHIIQNNQGNMLLSVFLFVICVWPATPSAIVCDLHGEPDDGSTFRVDYQYYPKAGGWLKLHRFPASDHDARHACFLEGALLASPIHEGLSMVMRSLAQEAQLHTFHTGIRSLATAEDFYSSEGVHLSRIPVTWAEGEPNNLDNKERCLTMAAEGSLADANCETMRPYFCYKEKRGHSTMNACGYHDKLYQVDPNTGHCYKFHATPRTWHKALTVCAAEGGNLAVINSEAEAQFIEKLVTRNVWFHLGFYRSYLDDSLLLTMEGTTLKEAGFSRWLKGQPDNYDGQENCGSFVVGQNNGLLELNDCQCSLQAAFVCEIPPIMKQ